MSIFIFNVALLAVSVSCVLPKEPLKEMVEVAGGSFVMGREDIYNNPPRRVTLDTFYMAKYPVTVGEWKAFLEDTGYWYNWDWESWDNIPFREIISGDDYPAQGLEWYEAVEYCNWLSEREGLEPCYTVEDKEYFYRVRDEYFDSMEPFLPEVTWNKKANGYRLPTDAEWEYAARGGQLSEGYLYAGSGNPEEVALYNRKVSYPVGQTKPNELGLYDMTGNVTAWCWDWYDMETDWLPKENPSVDSKSDVRKRSKDEFGKYKKVHRGMDWEATTQYLELNLGNVYRRDAYPPMFKGWIGIRLVRNK